MLTKYEITSLNMKCILKYYPLKLPTWAAEGPKNNASQCQIENIALPYKSVSPTDTATSYC